ncbi:hypothetical protein GPJ56_003536 [Histomonas meleagridis]|uniref:uncharacterized protein n=1 Tax=Histomonas meleagridis TaxID=135588 RepID=UPI0035597C49|nr:hypothetical protein GPJ56_003536 [Histomonas meleagridis]KAH0806422.1 hypothetical protein GO595_000797 [Histomonas meleagridis]
MSDLNPFDAFDPFALFGLNDDTTKEDFDDAFTLALNEIDKDSSIHFNDPFSHPNFIQQDIPQQHRRAVSSPMKIVTMPSQESQSPQQSYINQLPVAVSAFELVPGSQRQRFPREVASPQPVLRRPPDAFDDISNAAFIAACNDPNLTFNPHMIGFIPSTLWADRVITFGDIVSNFFQKKNNANSRFSHKLYNALKLSELSPIYPQFVGVRWLTPLILRVDKRVFARLLGIKSIDGSLFHQQGNFPSHGFFEIGAGDAAKYCPPGIDMTGVDFENVRLLIHSEHRFRKGCTEADIEPCKWANSHAHK